MFVKFIVVLMVFSLANTVQAVSIDSLKYYYIENELGGRIAVTAQAADGPVTPGKPFCYASNGDIVSKLSEPTLFATKVGFLDGQCKGKEGYISPGFIHRLFIQIEIPRYNK